ncbi:hypothetical protein ACFE04_029908 [Oxalis oulophora]
MPVARPQSSDQRVIAHLDMDCFYVQVEQRKQPELRGLPSAVVQYNEWKGGGLIAVSYEARKFGVKRSMRGDDAKQVCPDIRLIQVPVARGKADLDTYRNAGSEVVSILSRKGRCERASIDEVYLDLTDAAQIMLAEIPPHTLQVMHQEVIKSHVLGLNHEEGSDFNDNVKRWLSRCDADHSDKLLACGAIIVAELRMQVLKETEFTCSAGVAHNKMLAKLASAMNKPAQQTIVPSSSVQQLLSSFPIKKMKQLGGKLGSSLQSDLGVNTVGDLLQFSEEKLQGRYGVNTGTWLWNIARGISGEEVEGRLLPKSHGSGKSFPGPRALRTTAAVQHWLNQLCEELSERLSSDFEQNKRTAKTLTLNARAYKTSDSDSHKSFPSKSCPLRYGAAKMQEDAFSLFQAGLREFMESYGVNTHNSGWGITSLSVSASKIVDIPSGTASIMKYFHGQNMPSCAPSGFIQEAEPLLPSGSENYSENKSSEQQTKVDLREETASEKLSMPHLIQPEMKNILLQDQGPCYPSSEQTQDACTYKVSPLPPSGPYQSKSERQTSRTEPIVNKNAIPTRESHEQRRNKMKEQGTSSILNLFKNYNASSSSTKEQIADMSLNANKTEHGPGRNELRRDAWNYNIDEIDPAVMDELPPEIRQEIHAWLRPHKRPNTKVKTKRNIKARIKLMKRDVKKISEDQERIKVEQKEMQRKLEDIKSDCAFIKDEAEEITRITQRTQRRLHLIFSILEARKNKDFLKANILAHALKLLVDGDHHSKPQ